MFYATMRNTCPEFCTQSRLFCARVSPSAGPILTCAKRSQETLKFAGGKVPLGYVTEMAHSARLDNPGELKAWYDGGGDGRMELRSADGGGYPGVHCSLWHAALWHARQHTDGPPGPLSASASRQGTAAASGLKRPPDRGGVRRPPDG